MESFQERRLLRVVMWKRLDVIGAERCELWRERGGWSLAGAIVVEHPFVDVRYESLTLGMAWQVSATWPGPDGSDEEAGA